MSDENSNIINFMDYEELGKRIEDLVWEYDISYIEAVLMLAERFNIEEESIGNIIKSNQYIISKISAEAQALNFIEKESTLEFLE